MHRPKKTKSVPAFQSEADERVFWETYDTTEYVDWSRARLAVFPDLRPSTDLRGHLMAIGTLVETFEFSLYGVEVPASRFTVPERQLTAQLEPGTPLRLEVRVEDAAEPEADRWAKDYAQKLYRLLLRFARHIEWSQPPRSIHRIFTRAGPSPVTTVAASQKAFLKAVRPNRLLSQPEIDAIARDVELRVAASQPAMSAQRDRAIAMFTIGLESQDKVVRFPVFYSALAVAALFKWHDGKQQNVDKLLMERSSSLKVSQSPKTGKDETLYTKLRNDFIHAEERGGDTEGAIAAIEAQIDQFQDDVSLVLSNL